MERLFNLNRLIQRFECASVTHRILMFKACGIKMERTGNSEQEREQRNSGPSLPVGSLWWKHAGKLHIRECRSTASYVCVSFWCFPTFSQVFAHGTCVKLHSLPSTHMHKHVFIVWRQHARADPSGRVQHLKLYIHFYNQLSIDSLINISLLRQLS